MKFGKRLAFGAMIAIFLSVIALFGAPALDKALTDKTVSGSLSFDFAACIQRIKTVESCRTIWLCLEGVAVALGLLFVVTSSDQYKTQTQKITDTISIPAPNGEGQHGTARFMTHKEIKKAVSSYTVDGSNDLLEKLLHYGDELYEQAEKESRKEKVGALKKSEKIKDFTYSLRHQLCELTGLSAPINRLARLRERRLDRQLSKDHSRQLKAANKIAKNYISEGGIVIGYEKTNGKDVFYYLSDDQHVIVLGLTGAGKSRRMVIQSILTLALAGESIIATDPKGELYAYTHKLLNHLGYKVVVLDFENPEISSCYNPLQPTIDAIKTGNISKAQSCAWDLTSYLVQKSDHGEPIWTNGEMSVMAAAILCVVYDNRASPQFQNLTNVYWFLAEMCKDVKCGMTTFKPIVEYVKLLPDAHPAKPLLGISSVAPSKTAGSFYTSALTTLRLFITNEIYGMTNKSDFGLSEIGSKKEALFFILPDQKTTYYPIVTLIVSQIYNELAEYAKNSGNRLPIRVNFILDEFGNFAKITDFQTLLTVARSYGMRFNLFLQDFNQLVEKYGREVSNIIKGNCKTWVYLSSSDDETNKNFSDRLGKYTTSGSTYGSSSQRRTDASKSVNVSLIGRELLQPSEIAMIKPPYLLVTTAQEYPAVLFLPDLSKCLYNRMLGLGSKSHNTSFIKLSKAERRDGAEQRPNVQLWGVWKKFQPISQFGGERNELD